MTSTTPAPVATASFSTPVAVLGDIHGMSGLLRTLLQQLPPDMPIVLAGDVCDRGPDTRGVVDQLIARGAIGVRGNHDDWMIEWVSGGLLDPFALTSAMMGAETLASYGITSRDPAALSGMRNRIPEDHQRFFRSLSMAMDLSVCGQSYWVAHAGVPATVPLRGLSPAQVIPWLAEHQPESLLWPKHDAETMLPLDRTVIMGHVPRDQPIDTGNVLAIDTGSGRGGRLTAVILPERRFVTVGERSMSYRYFRQS